MPCYLFTYHAYGSWMADRPGGFVHRGQGLLPPDHKLAAHYRHNVAQDYLPFDANVQRLIVEECVVASEKQSFRLHHVATDPSHAHVLISWPDDRPWQPLRNGVKSSFTRRLNRDVRRRKWFSKGASRKQVRNRFHFDYLIAKYLPSHRGWKWEEGRGTFV